ncbi:hypothetical protein GALMADRAFT_133798 [Galerina marginata CBS 339.88]|uniref:Uncharacterized protein n=1 Tax=Galerina marginata (strain CBS 339.88) TaxID=685588 RepID=A0A067TQE2_GALM3|nr:hypothetical protein GALMADRAFT_133798 [Galerina marginata CBS 339.88]
MMILPTSYSDQHSTTSPVLYEHSDLHTSPLTLSWHPKITPYRLLTLTTTVGFGTWKTVSTQEGSTTTSTTIEWVTGTLLALLFFSVSSYDSREDAPWILQWLFKPDCMNFVWNILDWLSIPRPHYVSDEKYISPEDRSDHPPITMYRFLVSVVVASFGLSKAVIGFHGGSTAMTWADWGLGVPITTL